MNTFTIKKNYNKFLKKEFFKKGLGFQDKVTNCFSELYFKKNFSLSVKQNQIFALYSGKENPSLDPIFLNFSFDKNRLKSIVAWFLEKYGQYKTIQLLENLKEFGFGYATKAGLSLGIDDLKIPSNKIALIAKAETKVSKDLMDFRNSKITGIERTQRLIYTWNETNDMLKQEVIKYFEKMDLFNPIYMMAFSGARGNMSQVRQLVGMRGLMSDPQGQIIDFPIQSNFREGLTLTEYLISTYGARKGIVDTALRTATAGYLTRRLVDVAQHVIVSQFDCETSRGIFLFDMKEADKTIYSFQSRLIGRVLAQDIFSKKQNEGAEKTLIASRNQEVDSKLAFAIAKVAKKALVRSPLTCETPRLICQLCYGWSLSHGKLVSVGEAVGVIAAQSIGEPGTQLTMRTFHTGGVFAGGLTDQILAPFDGKIQYFHNIPGSCVRISLSEIAFFTKMPGSFFVIRDSENKKNIQNLSFAPYADDIHLKAIQNDWNNKNKNISEIYKIPAYAILFMRNHEFVQKKQVLAQFSTVAKRQLQYGSAEQTLYSTLAGEFYLNTSSLPFEKKNNLKKVELIVETRNSDCFDLSNLEFKNDILWRLKDWTNIWILSGKVVYNFFDSNTFFQEGDFLKKTTVLNRILWKKTKNWSFCVFQKNTTVSKSNFYAKKRLYFLANERYKNSKPLFKNSFTNKHKTKFAFQKTCFMNLWTSSDKQVISTKNEFLQKNKSFEKQNFTWKTFFVSSLFSKNCLQTNVNTEFQKKQQRKSILKFHIFPFEPFSANFSNSYKNQNFKHKKFFSSKKDIIFSGTFQKYFVFSSQKQQIFENSSKLISKQKKAFKQIFFKFSTFARTYPFFKVYNFAKKFNLSQRFVKQTSFTKQNVYQKNVFSPIFVLSEKPKIWYQSQQLFLSNQKKVKMFNKKHFTKQGKNIFCFATSGQDRNIFSGKKTKFVFLNKVFNFSFFNFSTFKNFKNSKNVGTFQKSESKQIVLKKTVFCVQYQKIRYKKFGYLFSFSDLSKNKIPQHSFRTLTTLKQSSIIENQKANLGKQQKGILIGNENFFGKDLPTFLSYFFPKNYQTLTNGVFTILFFENFSKKQKFTRFLCLKQKSFLFDLFNDLKFLNTLKRKKDRKKQNFPFQQKNVTFLTSSTFSALPKNTNGFSNEVGFFFPSPALTPLGLGLGIGKKTSNLFANKKQTEVFQDFGRKNFAVFSQFCISALPTKEKQNIFNQNKQFYKNFSFVFPFFCMQKEVGFFAENKKTMFLKDKHSIPPVQKNTNVKNLNSFVFFGLETSKNNKILNNFNTSQLYTEEIFWLPQENYVFSILDFNQKNMISSQSGKNLKKQRGVDNKKQSFVSDRILQRIPLFYSSNRQGKKKPFFSSFEGIWNWSIFSNKGRYQSSLKNQKILKTKKKVIQQKISFYKDQNQKLLKQKRYAFPFFYIRKNNKTKGVQKLYVQKKSSLKFLQWKFFFKNFYKTKNFMKKNSVLFQPFVNDKKPFVFSQKTKQQKSSIFVFAKSKNKKQKKRKFFNLASKVYFANKIHKKLTKNFISHFQKQKQNVNFEKSKKLFFLKVYNSKMSEKVQIQNKIGQSLNSNCFTCLPFKKLENSMLFSSTHLQNQKQENYKTLSVKHMTLSSSNIQEFNPFQIESQQIHMKIQAGWICYFPNTSFLSNLHQTIANQGHFFAKDLCFEQNKILQEAVVLKSSSISSNPQPIIFKENVSLPKNLTNSCLNFGFQTKGTEKTNFANFSIQFLKTNFNCRFQNNASLSAFENFEKSFSTNAEFNKQKSFQIQLNSEIQDIDFLKNTCVEKLCKVKKTLALFIRPMQYKLVENSRNYKNIFLNATLQNSSPQKNSISFLSSLKIYKKYHSNFLNFQKPEKIFLQNIKNIDTIVRTVFHKIHFRRKFKYNSDFSKMFSLRTYANRVKKDQNFADFGFTKNDTNQKSLLFKSHSKKNLVFKFQNLLDRNLSTNLFQPNQENQASSVLKTHLYSQHNFYQKNFHNHYFFSFYPLQFLPLSVSESSHNHTSFGLKNGSLSFPLVFFNAVNATIDFSVCQHKSAFFNQRSLSKNLFKKDVEISSFWLNKDGLHFVVPKNFADNTENFWKNLLTLQHNQRKTNVLFPTFGQKVFSEKSTSSQKKQSLLNKPKNTNSKTKTQLFKNFVFQKNSSFYANTKILSPFQGELISMQMNETNWWKKASEISTIQKLNNLFSVVTKQDLFAINFSNSDFEQTQNSRVLKSSQQNGKMNSFYQNDSVKNLQQNISFASPFEKITSFSNAEKEKNNSQTTKEKYALKNKQQHLITLYEFVFKILKPVEFVDSSKKHEYTHEISSFITKYENKLYKFKKLKIGYPILSKTPSLGKFFVYGDCLFNFAIRKPGQIVHVSCFKVTLRRGQPFLVSPNGILHLANTPYIQKNVPILTLPYQTVQSGDIVQGIPKVEQLFEARTTIQGRLFLSSLPILLKGIFERYKTMLPLDQAVRQSFLKIQQLIVDGVQRVYRSQGVSIVDKHLEVIVRQMTTKVQILHGAQTGFFPGELVNLDLIERINKFLLVKIRYEPVVLGITRASLEVDSFLSASSFQQTTKILSLAAISRKKDFLKGLKENILVGNLIPSGTGYMVLRKNI